MTTADFELEDLAPPMVEGNPLPERVVAGRHPVGREKAIPPWLGLLPKAQLRRPRGVREVFVFALRFVFALLTVAGSCMFVLTLQHRTQYGSVFDFGRFLFGCLAAYVSGWLCWGLWCSLFSDQDFDPGYERRREFDAGQFVLDLDERNAGAAEVLSEAQLLELDAKAVVVPPWDPDQIHSVVTVFVTQQAGDAAVGDVVRRDPNYLLRVHHAASEYLSTSSTYVDRRTRAEMWSLQTMDRQIIRSLAAAKVLPPEVGFGPASQRH